MKSYIYLFILKFFNIVMYLLCMSYINVDNELYKSCHSLTQLQLKPFNLSMKLPLEMHLYFFVISLGLSRNSSLEISGQYKVNVESPSPKTAHLFRNIHFKFKFPITTLLIITLNFLTAKQQCKLINTMFLSLF